MPFRPKLKPCEVCGDELEFVAYTYDEFSMQDGWIIFDRLVHVHQGHDDHQPQVTVDPEVTAIVNNAREMVRSLASR